ncbi:hypothetical protein [Streptomyces sp. NRRL S-495]|uniref:hypothetical protein n=1 Tax=Streptomyces sp. NRRL S-495 TaxID=1609133 RepID=UPI0005F97613|nr:hypothetical protein [Streptomyces sp. NRRL S-495]KJY39375.1 hypothetical protein VR45_03110 [Streptomyces sp. NRRL S-495]
MGELAGELMALVADGFLRTLRVARARRRLAAGRPVRIPCSARADERPGYVAGKLRLTPGAPTATFTARDRDRLELAVGGTFEAPEPDAWHDQDWAATAYRAPGADHPVYLQVDSRYLPLLHASLLDPAVARTV